MKPRDSRKPILVQKFIDFYRHYETLGLKITFIMISLQLSRISDKKYRNMAEPEMEIGKIKWCNNVIECKPGRM